MTDHSPAPLAVPGQDHSPDPHGQAALLLVESLIHGLIERGTVTVAQALEVIDVAREVKRDFGEQMGDSAQSLKRSLTILDDMRGSLMCEPGAPSG